MGGDRDKALDNVIDKSWYFSWGIHIPVIGSMLLLIFLIFLYPLVGYYYIYELERPLYDPRIFSKDIVLGMLFILVFSIPCLVSLGGAIYLAYKRKLKCLILLAYGVIFFLLTTAPLWRVEYLCQEQHKIKYFQKHKSWFVGEVHKLKSDINYISNDTSRPFQNVHVFCDPKVLPGETWAICFPDKYPVSRTGIIYLSPEDKLQQYVDCVTTSRSKIILKVKSEDTAYMWLGSRWVQKIEPGWYLYQR